jgi:hypothetical protein
LFVDTSGLNFSETCKDKLWIVQMAVIHIKALDLFLGMKINTFDCLASAA